MIRKIGIGTLPPPPSHLDHPCGTRVPITKTIWRARNWGQWGRIVKLTILSHPVIIITKFKSLLLFTSSLIQ